MAKRKPHEQEIRRGVAELESLGVGVSDPSESLVARLEEHLGKNRDVDLAIIYTLGKTVNSAAAAALIRLEQKTSDKETLKEIRRSLFKLAQRGIVEPRAEERSPPSRARVFSVNSDIEGYMSSVDGAGGRLVWLAKPQAGSGIQLLQAMVSDREGLQQVGGALIRRKELRRMTQEIKEKHGVTMIAVPWDYGDQILYEGYEKAKASGGAGIENYSALRRGFHSGRPKRETHPIYDRLSAADCRSGAWRESSRRLLDEPEFRAWILDEDWIGPYLQELQEAQGSRIVLNPLQKEERLAGIVREAVRTVYFGDRGKIFQRRLEDMALYLLETKRPNEAGLAFAVALQLKEADPGPLDIAFLTGLVQKSFAYYTSQEKAKEEEEPSLIVKP